MNTNKMTAELRYGLAVPGHSDLCLFLFRCCFAGFREEALADWAAKYCPGSTPGWPPRPRDGRWTKNARAWCTAPVTWSTRMAAIDGERLLRDLYAVREIGKYLTGVHRPTFSPHDIEARHWLAARLADAGLDSSIDGIGNVYRPRPPAGPQAADRQPPGNPEPGRLAGWRHGHHLRAGARPLARAAASTSPLVRRGRPFRLVHRQPLGLRRC